MKGEHVKSLTTGLLLLLLLTACGPTPEEKIQAAVDVYTTYEAEITGKCEAIDNAISRVNSMSPDEINMPADLKQRPPVVISTYPENGWVVFDKKEIDARLKSVKSLHTGVDIRPEDTVDNVKRSSENEVKALRRIRYLGIIRILDMKMPKTAGKSDFKEDGITVGFIPGEASARVFLFDLTDKTYLGSVAVRARSSENIELTPTEFQAQLNSDLRQKIREAAEAELQWGATIYGD